MILLHYLASVPRLYAHTVDNEEIDMIQKRIRISFNQQVNIARVALDEMG